MGVRILVVDDDGGPAMFAADALRRGRRGRGGADGGAGLAAVERHAPDAVVLDVAMPGLDGLAVCRRLRAGGLSTTPVLLLTARDAVADRVAGLEAGADDYLVEHAVEELLARLAAIRRRGTARAARAGRRRRCGSSARRPRGPARGTVRAIELTEREDGAAGAPTCASRGRS